MNRFDDKSRQDYYNDNYVDGEGYRKAEQKQNRQSSGLRSTMITGRQLSEERKITGYPDKPVRENIYDRNIGNPKCRGYAPPVAAPKKKKKALKVILIILAVLLCIVLIFGIYIWIKMQAVPQKTNLLIMATDEDGTRTDTLMLCTFDKSTEDMSLISIPRDTYVTVSDSNYEAMCEDYPQPGSQSMKINTVHHFSDKKDAVDATIDEVERLLDTDIDFYLKVDFDTFRYIVDSIGGVRFYVPQDMKYDDPYQELHIDLKEGEQVLDGEQAEHLLRYRSGYATADLGRVEVQQNFMKALISQTLSKDTILSNPKAYFDLVFKYDFLETDAGISDMLTYAFLSGGLDTDNITTMTLPGTSSYAGGQSVYMPDMDKIENEISEIINE